MKACLGLPALLLLLLVVVLLLFVLIIVLVVVIPALGLVLVGAVSNEVTRLATLKAGVVAPSLVVVAVIEAHELLRDQGKLLVLENFMPLL